MRERLEAVKGTLDLASRPGHTIVVATVPLSVHGVTSIELQANHS
jgi:two-component system, NarL family, sensor kinase